MNSICCKQKDKQIPIKCKYYSTSYDICLIDKKDCILCKPNPDVQYAICDYFKPRST